MSVEKEPVLFVASDEQRGALLKLSVILRGHLSSLLISFFAPEDRLMLDEALKLSEHLQQAEIGEVGAWQYTRKVGGWKQGTKKLTDQQRAIGRAMGYVCRFVNIVLENPEFVSELDNVSTGTLIATILRG